jgi:multiple sugar transport system substrate-binding protein
MLRKLMLVVGCLGLALAACGQTGQQAPAGAAPAAEVAPTAVPTSAPAAEPPDGPVSFMIFGDPAEKAAYEGLVAAFTQKYPQIEVQLIHIPDQGDYRTRLGTDFAAGTPADIVLINYRRYASFAAKGVLEPLGPYLAGSALIKEGDFYPEALAPFYWQGTLMCIPQNLSSLVVYYNKQLFDAAGLAYPKPDWTWDDFLQTAKALTKDTNGDGTPDQYGLGTEISIFRAAPFIWQNGGDLVDDPAKPTALALSTPAAIQALQWFVDLQVTHHVVPDAVQEQAEDSESRFQNGTLGMFLNSRRGVPTYRQISGFDWDVAPLPQGKQRAGILHADAYCMPTASKNKAATWTFIEFANSPEGQTIVAASGRTVPSLKAIAESPAFLDPSVKPQSSQVFLDVIPHIRGVPVMETWVDIEELLGDELTRAYYGEVSVEQMIGTATTRANMFFVR